MMVKFLYSTFTDKNIKALPGAVDRTIDPNDISNHIREQMNDRSLGIRDPYLSGEIELDPDEGENSTIESFFDGKKIPSFEEEIGRASCSEKLIITLSSLQL